MLLLQSLLKKVTNSVSEITVSHEMDMITRMEVCSVVITEMEKMFTMLAVSTTFSQVFPSCKV